MVLFKLNQYAFGMEPMHSIHLTRAECLANINLPMTWDVGGNPAAFQTGPNQWTVYVEVEDERGTDAIEIATITRLG